VTNACLLAERFVQEGFETVICDVLSDQTAALYRRALAGRRLWIVLLLPSWPEVQRRTHTRPLWLTPEQVRLLYEQQQRLSAHDTALDNSSLSAQAAAAWLDTRWPRS